MLGSIRSLSRRLPIERLSILLALFPLAAFVWLAWQVPVLDAGETLSWKVSWLPSLGLSLGFYLDALSALFALLVTLIGALIVVYGGQYFKGADGAWRFQTYTLLFMAAMLGVVMAGDVISLFIFWEATSVVSFLLVAYKYKDESVRRSAFKALFITGGGGIALLAGLLWVANTAGDTQFSAILMQGDALRGSPYYLAMLALVSFGAFTKSAQFPAHIWLPGAMDAPTPASAYLHSATMVKAGIYLLARLNPALGFTEAWFWILTVFGMLTMVLGAYLGLKQNDLKALLAYSTICQLGILIMLIGQDDKTAYKALVIGVLAHALYKSALFMVAGIVDHETGTRDLRRLGGLWRKMPYTFGIAALAALSMAGLPPLFGFLAKETLLATSLHPSLPMLVSELFTLSSVVAGALMLAMSGLLVWDGFLGSKRDPNVKAHEAPALMWLMPAIPAVLSLIFAQLPGPKEEATLLAKAASAAFGEEVKVSLKLWTGLNVPLVLSLVAISLGALLFIFRQQVRSLQGRIAVGLSLNFLYEQALQRIDSAAYRVTRLQGGRLHHYLVVILAAAVILVVGFSGTSLFPELEGLSLPSLTYSGELELLRLFAIVTVIGTALSTVWLERDFAAVLALSALGFSVSVLFILEPAPDVALVQVVVDILSVVVLVLALTRLPRAQRLQAQELTKTTASSRAHLIRDALVAGAIGLVVMLLTLGALTSRPRQSAVSGFYADNAKLVTGAKDIVGAVVVDFRSMDTLIEISVFGIAGLGIYTLLYFASRKHGDVVAKEEKPTPTEGSSRKSFGISGPRVSAFIRIPAFVTLPLSIILAATHVMYGHDQPGDGFTAGVIISLAVGLWYVVFGYHETRRRLWWMKPSALISVGILLAIFSGAATALLRGNFLANVDFGELVGLPLPEGFHISSSFLFEVAICLGVLGSAGHMLDSLGHPDDRLVEEG
jgi:NADH:ubiquinone oxidoreductase subunit 5 (subunit L)/multisubunit Na+/H+ antiporter MnhA subunit